MAAIDHDQRLVNAKAAAQAMVDDVADAATLAEQARCVGIIRDMAGAFAPDDCEHAILMWAAKRIEAPK